jgi:hypothetical protein
MNATERRFQILVTVETLTFEGENFNAQVDEIRERIEEALTGHRTPKRLADYARAVFQRIIYEGSRQIGG